MIDDGALFGQVGVVRRHPLDCGLGEPDQEWLAAAEYPAVAHRPPQETARDVATLLIAGIDAVAHQERHRTRVVGDDPEGTIELGVFAIRRVEGRLGRFDQRPEQIRLVVRLCLREHGAQAFEAGPSVHTSPL